MKHKKLILLCSILVVVIILVLIIFMTNKHRNYIVTYDSNGGSILHKEEVRINSLLNEPNPPIKKDHLFDGWYLNGLPYDFESSVNSDITLEAQWKSTLEKVD